jgi:hypothetical protein
MENRIIKEGMKVWLLVVFACERLDNIRPFIRVIDGFWRMDLLQF